MKEEAGANWPAAPPLDLEEEEEEEPVAVEDSEESSVEEESSVAVEAPEVEVNLMEVEVAPFLQTKESPWMPPLLCKLLNESHE